MCGPIYTMEKPINIIDKTCQEMNSAIRFLARVYHSKVNSDESYRYQKTLNTAINADPTLVIKTVGPYLLKYGEPISNHEEKFFLEKDYSDDAKEEEDAGKAMKAINAVKSVYLKCSKDERAKIMDTVSDMLSHY